MRPFFSAICFVLISSTAQAASIQSEVAKAEKAYASYKYKDAVKKLEALVARRDFADALLRQRITVLLAFSYYYLRNEQLAADTLISLFRENVDYAIDVDEFHPNVVAFFNREHNRFVESLAVAPASMPVVPASAPMVVQAAEPASAPINIVTAPPAPKDSTGALIVRALPLGIGHFSNRDFAMGGVFLGSEIALATLNIVSSVLKYNMRGPDGSYPDTSAPDVLHVLQNAAAFTLIGVVALEIIDAYVFSPARGKR